MPPPEPSLPTAPTPAPALEQRESQVRGQNRRYDRVFTRGMGCVLIEDNGRRCIDFLAADGALAYGHNDPDMLQALVMHLQRHGLSAGPDLHSNAKQQFVKAFCSLILAPRHMSHRLQFTGPTPADALAAAIALARKITGRSGLIAFTHGGPIDPASALHGAWRHPYEGTLGPDVDSAEQLAQLLAQPASGLPPPAAIVLELVQSRGRLHAASAPWVRRIAALAQRHGALLVVDDRLAGAGRTGDGYFSFDGMGVMPDLIVPATATSGMGLPMGLLLVRSDRDCWAPAEWSSPVQHNHHAFVTAAAACEKFWRDDKLVRQVARRAALMGAGLQEMARLVPGAQVVGRGLLQGLCLPHAAMAEQVVCKAYERGLMLDTASPGSPVLRPLPPLTTSTVLLEQGLALLHRAVADVVGCAPSLQAHRALRSARRHAAQRLPAAGLAVAPAAATPAAPAASAAPAPAARTLA